MRREYKHGSKYALWRWKDIYWNNQLYLRRLILFQCPLFSIMLHWFHSPDMQRHLHDHPVSMLSVILKGWYLEERESGQHIRDFLNWIPSTTAHRIASVSFGTITLCFAGRRKREWGFHTEDGWIHWKDYHTKYEGSTS